MNIRNRIIALSLLILLTFAPALSQHPVPTTSKPATLAELRFNSIAGWLPDDEASALRVSFKRETNRLYAVAETDEMS